MRLLVILLISGGVTLSADQAGKPISEKYENDLREALSSNLKSDHDSTFSYYPDGSIRFKIVRNGAISEETSYYKNNRIKSFSRYQDGRLVEESVFYESDRFKFCFKDHEELENWLTNNKVTHKRIRSWKKNNDVVNEYSFEKGQITFLLSFSNNFLNGYYLLSKDKRTLESFIREADLTSFVYEAGQPMAGLFLAMDLLDSKKVNCLACIYCASSNGQFEIYYPGKNVTMQFPIRK